MCAVVRRSPSVQSVDRAITVMEFLSRRGWSGVTEVSREMDIHKSTAYRLLTTLRDRGLVEQDAATEKYRLGFGMVLLARTVSADLDILRCAKPVCERLSERTEETVTIAVLEGDDAVIIHQSLSRASALSVDWTGRHTPSARHGGGQDISGPHAGGSTAAHPGETAGAFYREHHRGPIEPERPRKSDSGRRLWLHRRGTGDRAERGRGADSQRRRSASWAR